jgi:hypothetical protein
MRHEHASRALVKLLQIGKTPSGADPLLQHAPEAFHGIEVVSAAGWQELQPKLLLPVGQRRGELVGAVDATAVDHHDHLFPGGAKAGHDLMDILPKPFRIKLGDHFIKDVRRPILDGADDTEPHAAGHTAPTPIAPPRLALEHFFTLDLACTQWSGRQAIPLGFAVPPACPGEGETPQDRFIFIEQNDLATPGAVLQGAQVERRPRQLSGSGTEPSRGTVVADVFFSRAAKSA